MAFPYLEPNEMENGKSRLKGQRTPTTGSDDLAANEGEEKEDKRRKRRRGRRRRRRRGTEMRMEERKIMEEEILSRYGIEKSRRVFFE